MLKCFIIGYAEEVYQSGNGNSIIAMKGNTLLVLFSNDEPRVITNYTIEFLKKYKPNVIIEHPQNPPYSTPAWEAERLATFDRMFPYTVLITVRRGHLGRGCSSEEFDCAVIKRMTHECIGSFARSAERFFSNVIYERLALTIPMYIDFDI